MIGHAAMQEKQQQKSRRFGCRNHHDPELRAESQNQIQQSPHSFSASESLSQCAHSVGVCGHICLRVGGDERRGQSMKHSDENPRLVYLDLETHSFRLVCLFEKFVSVCLYFLYLQTKEDEKMQKCFKI